MYHNHDNYTYNYPSMQEGPLVVMAKMVTHVNSRLSYEVQSHIALIISRVIEPNQHAVLQDNWS